jgi:hypothetical protein
VAGKYMIKAIKYDEESDRISAAIWWILTHPDHFPV